MDDELVTIATFWSPVEARLARSTLNAADIPCFLVGEEVVNMNWVYSNAVGGIRLQVATQDVPRAHLCLAEAGQVPAEELVRAWSQAEAASAGATDLAHDEETTTVREQNAERAWRGAGFGLWFFPLQFYVFYLLQKVYFSEDELSDQHRRRAWLAAAINLPLIFGFCLVVGALLRVFGG